MTTTDEKTTGGLRLTIGDVPLKRDRYYFIKGNMITLAEHINFAYFKMNGLSFDKKKGQEP